MAINWIGIRCKSFTLPGKGGELVIAETIDRTAIEISVRQAGAPGLPDTLSVRLSKEQFNALCNMNSAYDGLEVLKEVTDEAPELIDADFAEIAAPQP